MTSSIHPIDYRYGSDEMRRIFSRETWLEYFKLYELKLLEVLNELGIVKLNIDVIRESFSKVSLKDVNRWEDKVRHEAMAVVLALGEVSKEHGKYIHLGATSNDVLDTVMALQIREAHKLIIHKLNILLKVLYRFIEKYIDAPILGRTHGRSALPISLGFRFSLYLDELYRIYKILCDAIKYVAVGKYGGAVGSQVELYPKQSLIEEKLMKKLGLDVASFYLQIIPRDRLAYYLFNLLLLSTILEHMANEVRILQSSGIEEIYEPFREEQIGSSIMPHKRNPIISEKICGLSRKLRSLSPSILENIVFEHERDLRNSSFERCILPETFLLVDEQLDSSIKLVKGISPDLNKIRENIERESPYIFSDLIIQLATLNGADRQEVYRRIREIFINVAHIDEEKFLKAILEDDYLSKFLDRNIIDNCMNLKVYIDAVVHRVKSFLSNIDI